MNIVVFVGMDFVFVAPIQGCLHVGWVGISGGGDGLGFVGVGLGVVVASYPVWCSYRSEVVQGCACFG